MGITMQHPPPPSRLLRNIDAPFRWTIQSKNRTAFTRMVKVTLKTTLTSNQNKHPLPPNSEPPFVRLESTCTRRVGTVSGAETFGAGFRLLVQERLLVQSPGMVSGVMRGDV